MNSTFDNEGVASYFLEDCLRECKFSTSCRFNDHVRGKAIINHCEVGDNYIFEIVVSMLGLHVEPNLKLF